MIIEAVNSQPLMANFSPSKTRFDMIPLVRSTMTFTTMAYFLWRVFNGDLTGGLSRRIRRARGIYLEDSVHDNAEYHVTRNGVDQDIIRGLLKEQSFDCNIVSHFSTQSRFFQPIFAVLSMENTFAVVPRNAC